MIIIIVVVVVVVGGSSMAVCDHLTRWGVLLLWEIRKFFSSTFQDDRASFMRNGVFLQQSIALCTRPNCAFDQRQKKNSSF
uniref:Putative secreted protein n=1 Tax=Anopheles darlingi TaxID=43151 RepID=A0A2M4DMG9_ANODA